MWIYRLFLGDDLDTTIPQPPSSTALEVSKLIYFLFFLFFFVSVLPLFSYSIKVSSVSQLVMVVEWYECETLELPEREREFFSFNLLSAYSPLYEPYCGVSTRDHSRAFGSAQCSVGRRWRSRRRRRGGKGKVSWSCQVGQSASAFKCVLLFPFLFFFFLSSLFILLLRSPRFSNVLCEHSAETTGLTWTLVYVRWSRNMHDRHCACVTIPEQIKAKTRRQGVPVT